MTIGQQVTIPPIPHANLIEKIIAGRLVEAALAAGYSISVWDGEEIAVDKSVDPAVIFPALCSTDSDVLRLHNREDGDYRGRFWLIWGNGRDLISDYTDNEVCNSLFNPISEWLDKELS